MTSISRICSSGPRSPGCFFGTGMSSRCSSHIAISHLSSTFQLSMALSGAPLTSIRLRRPQLMVFILPSSRSNRKLDTGRTGGLVYLVELCPASLPDPVAARQHIHACVSSLSRLFEASRPREEVIVGIRSTNALVGQASATCGQPVIAHVFECDASRADAWALRVRLLC
jgi:hypothetical protein